MIIAICNTVVFLRRQDLKKNFLIILTPSVSDKSLKLKERWHAKNSASYPKWLSLFMWHAQIEHGPVRPRKFSGKKTVCFLLQQGNEHKQFSDKQKAGGQQHIYSARTTRVNESVNCKVSMFLNTTEGKKKFWTQTWYLSQAALV